LARVIKSAMSFDMQNLTRISSWGGGASLQIQQHNTIQQCRRYRAACDVHLSHLLPIRRLFDSASAKLAMQSAVLAMIDSV